MAAPTTTTGRRGVCWVQTTARVCSRTGRALDPPLIAQRVAARSDAANARARAAHEAMEARAAERTLFSGLVTRRVPVEWRDALAVECAKPYMRELEAALARDRKDSVVLPPLDLVFEALRLCAPDRVRVVIVGQDPYVGAGQAHGLAFSVPRKFHGPLPPSLVNIFREVQRDARARGAPVRAPADGDLGAWARQGVLLLNTHLTVRRGEPGSHAALGWQRFTDAVLRVVCAQRERAVVFMLWGRHARAKAAMLGGGDDNDDTARHLVLETSHPSPKSVACGFDGCGHFGKCNEHLARYGAPTVRWAEPLGAAGGGAAVTGYAAKS